MTGETLQSLGVDIWRRWRSAFALDHRALAVFRIGLGLLLLSDLFSRALDFHAHYTEAGVMPLESAEDFSTHAPLLPLHLVSESSVWQGALFVFLSLFAVGLCLGLYTRFCVVGAWFLLGAIQARNPLLLYGADNVLMLLLLWSVFLPLGSKWGIDSWRYSAAKRNVFDSLGSVAYVLQIGVIYFFSFLSKKGEAWMNGTAVETVLHLDQYTAPLGRELLSYPSLLRGLNWGTLGIELLAPLCLLVPHRRARLAAVVSIAMLQLGFAACMELGLFPWVSLLALVPLLGAWGVSEERSEGVLAARGWRVWADSVCAGLIVLMFVGNILVSRNEYQRNRLKNVLPGIVVEGMERLRMDQSWSMFSPDPPVDDGWLVFEATLMDGQVVDLLRDGKIVQWEKPVNVAERFGGDRWKAYFLNLVQRGLSWNRAVEVFVRRWNEGHGDGRMVRSARVVFMREETVLGGRDGVERVELYRGEAAQRSFAPPGGGA